MSADNGYANSILYPPEIIDDGYELEGEIAGLAGQYPDTRFRYRPAMGAEYVQYLSNALDVEGARNLLLKQLRWWNVTLPDGTPAPIDKPTVQLVKDHAVFAIRGIVLGLAPRFPDRTETGLEEVLVAQKNSPAGSG